jgi:tetratricopeptide (TPR) repeat protein
VLILRVRQCEVAIGEGRLDEAMALIQSYPIANHRRGQRVITRLVAKLVDRANEHLKALRYNEALADCEKAAKLGGNQPDVVALRAAAMDGLTAHQREQRGQARLVADVRRHLDQGQLSMGEGLLAGAAADATVAVALRKEIHQKRAVAAATVKAARRAVDAGDWSLAVARLAEGRAADPNDSTVMALAGEAISKLQSQASEALNEGQLDRAVEWVARLSEIDPRGLRTKELAQAIGQLKEAWRWVMTGEYGEAKILMARIAPVLAKAPWVKRVIEQLEKAEAAIAELRTGPLGWVESGVSASDETKFPSPGKSPSPPPSPGVPGEEGRFLVAGTLPASLILRVDGVGSYLVLRQNVLSVGAVSSSRPCDVALVAEPSLPIATIERVEDDYFLRTRVGQSKLLASGDKVELSPRCRMVFRVPSRASTSAVLDLTGARLPRSDVRRVILMDQDLVIAPGAAAHVQAEQIASPVVLYVSHGQLWARTQEGGATPQAVALGAHMNVGGVSFVVTSNSDLRR